MKGGKSVIYECVSFASLYQRFASLSRQLTRDPVGWPGGADSAAGCLGSVAVSLGVPGWCW